MTKEKKEKLVSRICIGLLVLGLIAIVACGVFFSRVPQGSIAGCIDYIAKETGATSYSYTYKEMEHSKDLEFDVFVINFYTWKPSDSYSQWITTLSKGVFSTPSLVYFNSL